MKHSFRILALFLIAAPALAQSPDYWVPMEGPWGGNVSVIVEPEPGLLVAASDDGVFRTRQLPNWEKAQGIPDNVSIISIAVGPGGLIFGGSSNGGIFRSMDLGAIWQLIDTGLPSTYWESIAVNPTSQEVLAFGGQGLYRSTDLGTTWSATEGTAGRDLVFASTGDVYAQTGDSVVRSTDAARATWIATATGSAPSSMTTMAMSGSTIWVGTNGDGVHRSTDLGVSWTKMGMDTAMNQVSTVRIGSFNAEEQVLVGTESGGVYYSVNQGDTWEPLSDTSRRTIAWWLHRASDGTLLAATVKGVYQLQTSPVTEWVFAGHGIPNGVVKAVMVYKGLSDETLYAAQYTGSVHALDLTVPIDWSRYQDREIAYVASVAGMAMDSIGRLYMAIQTDQIYRSGVGIEGWGGIGRPPTTAFFSIAVNAAGTIFVGSDSGRVFRSVDGGTTWEASSTGSLEAHVGALAVAGETVWAATNRGLYRSLSGGVDWQQVGPSISYSVALGPGGRVYVGSYYGRVYRSSDGGETWDYTTTSASNPFIAALGVNARGDIFAAGMPAGIYRSTNGGATWSTASTGLTNAAVTSIAFDSEGRAYIGTYGGGIFASVESTTGIAPERSQRELDVTATPMPAADAITLRIVLPRPDRLHIEAFDAGGASLGPISDAAMPAGESVVRWDVSSLPAGVYFIRCTGSDGTALRSVVKVAGAR